MNVIDHAHDNLTRGTDVGWTLPIVAALGSDGRQLSITWVRRSVRRLLPYTRDEWLRNLMRSELDAMEDYETNEPQPEELDIRSENLHQIPHQGAQPAVHNLLIAYANSRFREDNQFAVNLEAALRLILEAAGNNEDHRGAVVEELVRVADMAEIDLSSHDAQDAG